MAEGEEATPQVDVEDIEQTPGYKPPAKKSMDEILNQDKEDESLEKYKAQLLGSGSSSQAVFWPEDHRKVIVKSLTLVVKDRPDVTLDLTGNLESLKNQQFILKEGCQYQLRINFCVQREIVTGLRLVFKTTRKGIKVDTSSHMVGSYAPNKEEQSFLTPMDECPSGMLARGDYKVASAFLDDDKNKILEWTWKMVIKKEWE